jgi:hypothetical protein
MRVERVLWGWNSSTLFLKFRCVRNSDMKSPLRLALQPLKDESMLHTYTSRRVDRSLLHFFYASHLGTAVVSVHTHARPLNTRTLHTPLMYKQTTTTIRSEDRVLLEITEILWFRRRRARHDLFVASRERETRQAETVYFGKLLFPVRHQCQS